MSEDVVAPGGRVRPVTNWNWRRCAAGGLCVLLSWGGCGGPQREPLDVLRDDASSTTARLRALEELYVAPSRAGESAGVNPAPGSNTASGTGSSAGSGMDPALRQTLKDVVWSGGPVELRLRAAEVLLKEGTESDREDTRRMLRLLLPRERTRTLAAYISDQARERGWKEFVPALVRRLSRPEFDVPDAERAEARAIEHLAPGASLAESAFAAFVNPGANEGDPPDHDARVRADAWDVLGRIDADGKTRARLLAAAPPTPVLERLEQARRELRVVPRVGGELSWLDALRAPRQREWWDEASAAIQRVSEAHSGVLALRHAEPVRWSAGHRSEWLSVAREELLAELERRMRGRDHHRRSAEPGVGRANPREDLDWARERLEWGDVLALLVVDEAVRAPAVRAMLFRQVDLDREDRTTEYGGILEAQATGEFQAPLFPPRPAQRESDQKFVASTDLILAADRALAIYHFHAHRVRNAEYAGPSPADLEFAARTGRTCVVFTSMSAGTLNVDCFFPSGVIVDLGDIKRP